MDPNELRISYEKRLPDFERAARNLREAVELLLAQRAVNTLSVTSRVKTFESFAGKIGRKAYSDPFSQTTDFVGIRVILYLPRDVATVVKLLHDELDVIEDEDTSQRLADNQFGYRSHHLLLRIPREWASTPSFRGLDRIQAEVQVRTLMMHAWADMAHSLQYKSTHQIPAALQRRLFLLSAKIEEADQQFEALVKEVEVYRRTVAEDAAKRGEFDTTLELNLDTFKELIRFFFPHKDGHEVMTQDLYQDVTKLDVKLPQLVQAAKLFKPLEPALVSELPMLNAPTLLAYALDLFVDGFSAAQNYSDERRAIIRRLASSAKTRLE